jgi:hypothetical protein
MLALSKSDAMNDRLDYDVAVRALAGCDRIEDAIYWLRRADELAAWAQAQREGKSALVARRLKLYCYRRLAALAHDAPESAGAVLAKAGFGSQRRMQILAIGRAPQELFDDFVQEGKAAGPAWFALRGVGTKAGRRANSEAYVWLVRHDAPTPAPKLQRVRSALRTRSPRDVGVAIAASETDAIRAMIGEVRDWLDELERHLPEDPGS